MKALSFDSWSLNESFKPASSNKVVKELSRLFALNIQRNANEHDRIIIPKSFKILDKVAKVPESEMMEQSRCYDNALEYSKKTGMKLFIGAFIKISQVKDDAEWMDSGDENKFNVFYSFYPHAFNVNDKGEIFDVTIYNSPDKWIYIGEEVDPKKFNKGFWDLHDHLQNLIKVK